MSRNAKQYNTIQNSAQGNPMSDRDRSAMGSLERPAVIQIDALKNNPRTAQGTSRRHMT